MQNIPRIITTLLIIITVQTLNIPLPRSRQTCLVVTQGSYQFEFVVSGVNEKEVRCVVEEKQKIIVQVIGRSQFQTEFNVTESQATICFSSLDTQPKAVSFDFIRLDDPLRGLIQDKQKMAIHEQLFTSFQQLEKLYRDQHFFIQRNFIHEILLRNTQVALIFFLIFKLLVVCIAAFFQTYYVKQLFDNNYRQVTSEENV